MKIDGIDWLDVSDFLPKTPRSAEVTICLTKPRRKAGTGKARASICFRGDAREWIEVSGPTFKVVVKPGSFDEIALVPDPEGRPCIKQHGVMRMILSPLPFWPDENRNAEVAIWDCSREMIRITLRPDWASAKKEA